MSEAGMSYVVSPRGIIKIVEVVLIVITMGMWFGLATGWHMFVAATILTAMFSTFAFAAQNMIIGPSRVAELLLYGLSAIFLFVSSIIIFVKLPGFTLASATGAFCILTSVAYGVDIFFTIQATDDAAS